ncbi:MAG: thioesterase family protein [Acidimicrobiia bacterium]
MQDEETLPRAANLVQLLDLEELDTDLYRARNPEQSFTPHLYGGQVAAQALRAAANTVEADRPPHSVHCYFPRRGEADIPTIMRVERSRDGRAFSARTVVAQQRGKAIFTASASFHVHEDSPDFDGHPLAADAGEPGPPGKYDRPSRLSGSTVIFDTRGMYPPGPDEHGYLRPSRRFWARSPEPLPDDPVVHACGLVYLSDMSTGFSETWIDDLPPGGPSIDHAMWFHRLIRADDWVYVDQEPVTAHGARGLYRGYLHDATGRLGATFVQETLLRPQGGFRHRVPAPAPDA